MTSYEETKYADRFYYYAGKLYDKSDVHQLEPMQRFNFTLDRYGQIVFLTMKQNGK